MDITDVQLCADYFKQNYLETFYLITTYSDKSFILIGERENFPHLMGINKNTYRSNGYKKPKWLFKDIIGRRTISRRIIPYSISTTSKMYKKIINFSKNINVFWKNKYPIVINYNASLSSSNLDHVDIILSDMSSGYMLGWVYNSDVPINANINIKKYCICTWMDESTGAMNSKEKYLPKQDVELIRYIFSFDGFSCLKRKKEYTYDTKQKEEVLRLCYRNRCNLILDKINSKYYVDLAREKSIQCMINGVPIK